LNPPINSNNIPDKTTEYIRIHQDQVITGLFKSYWKAFTERETLS